MPQRCSMAWKWARLSARQVRPAASSPRHMCCSARLSVAMPRPQRSPAARKPARLRSVQFWARARSPASRARKAAPTAPCRLRAPWGPTRPVPPRASGGPRDVAADSPELPKAAGQAKVPAPGRARGTRRGPPGGCRARPPGGRSRASGLPRPRGPARPAPPARRRSAAGEEPEGVVEPLQDLPRREYAHPRRRQLQREGEPGQAGADARHRTAVARGQFERGRDRPGALDEQPHRRGSGELLRGREPLGVRRREGRDPPLLLAGDLEGLAAGGQDPQDRAARQQGRREAGTGVEEVLAVVEDEQGGALSPSADERVFRGPAGRPGHARRGGHQ